MSLSKGPVHEQSDLDELGQGYDRLSPNGVFVVLRFIANHSVLGYETCSLARKRMLLTA